MIFGFNTDVKHGDTVYHVQSEARQNDFLFQTQVFVRGRCVGKRATSYADKATLPDFTDKLKEQQLREQHRFVLDSIRDGKLADILDKRDSAETLAAIRQLDLEWINADSVHSEGSLRLRLRITDGGSPLTGARVVSRFGASDADHRYSQATSDSSGIAEIRLDVDESRLADSAVLVQADHNGRTATRKFRLKKVEA
jgi:hypothetical protein